MELEAALAALRRRIAKACETAGREVETVRLIAVTKTYPADDVATLVRLGVDDIGESKEQEASAKVAETATLLSGPSDPHPPRWHFVGQLQRRKARSVARYAHAVHSVDRAALVPLLADGVLAAGRPPLEVFLQVSLDSAPGRGGVAAEDVPALADAVAEQVALRLRGVMAVAPLGADPDAAFAALAEVAARLGDRHPGSDAISAGMSGDLEAAVRHGATHLRVGSALLGRRAPVIG